MMEEVARGNDIFLLQTDFAKAYDYINRDAIKTILKHVQTPGQIVNISNKILQEARSPLPSTRPTSKPLGEQEYAKDARSPQFCFA